MTNRIYEDAAYRAASLNGCWWVETEPQPPACPPLHGAARAEFAVIGAGYTGLNAALELAQAGADVAVLDAQDPGWGASGRNGGFCCIGGAKATGAQIRKRWGSDDLQRFRSAERAAIELVAARLDAHAIDAQPHSAGEVQLAHRPSDFTALQAEADEMRAAFGADVRLISAAEMAGEGMGARGLHGGLHVGLGFALNPRRYALGLTRAAQAAGARIHGQSAVTAITREGADYVLRTATGSLRARHLLIATNGYSSDDLPGWMRNRYLPAPSSVLVTRPLTEDEIAAQGWSTDLMAYDTRHMLHYFRLMPDRRMLFGMRGSLRWTDPALAAHRRLTRAHFDAMFPAWKDVETPFFWSGLVCLARDLVPFIGAVPGMENAFAAFAYHGNGVAMGSWAGTQMARLALGRPTELPGFCGRVPQRFELGRFRRLSLPIAGTFYQIQDRI